MSRKSMQKGILVSGLLSLVLLSGISPARASDDCQPACRYVCLTTYVSREVPYTKLVTRYDHCGRPDKVARTCYETVRIPVKRLVRVCD